MVVTIQQDVNMLLMETGITSMMLGRNLFVG